MSSPTSRTLAVLRKQGLRAQVVEKWIPQARRRVDLFGFIDLLFIEGHYVYISDQIMIPADKWQLVGVQVCAGASHSTRRKKILTACRDAAYAWLHTGCAIQIRSWSKRKVKLKNGKKADRWTERIQQITLGDFE